MVINKNKRFLILLIVAITHIYTANGMFGITLFRPWDINVRPPRWAAKDIQPTVWFEKGLKARGVNAEGDEVNVLQIWTPTQDALAMLEGFPQDNPITEFLNHVLNNPSDDGTRGHFEVTGKLDANAACCALRYHAPHNITVSGHLPFYMMKLSRVNFVDLTRDITPSDALVKQELTSMLVERVAQFDQTLNLGGWDRVGLGDFTLLFEWLRDFPQPKPILKNVALNVRTAITIPTGIKENVNDVFSIPFGLDGAVGFVFGGGITVDWFNHFNFGLDFEFIQLFGNTRDRRIKTSPLQTDFLLLAKVPAHKDFGFTQRYNLFAQAYRLWHGLSASITYQFWRHNDDRLSLLTNSYSNQIANTAESLQEWTFHNLIFRFDYDFQWDIEDSSFNPQCALFYKLPFNGKRAILVHSVGGIVSLNF
jgi:hypothetical protein